jgi:hypothetical protein
MKPMVLYKNKVRLPRGEKRLDKGSIVFLLTPNLDSVIRTINNPLFDTRYYEHLFIERDVSYFIGNREVVNEDGDITEISMSDKFLLEDHAILETDNQIFLSPLTEVDGEYMTVLKRMLYNDRMKTPKTIVAKYNEYNEKAEKKLKWNLTLNLYRKANLFYDISYYTETFFKNLKFEKDKALGIYLEFLQNYLNSFDMKKYGYTKKTLIIPLEDWYNVDKTFNYINAINPITLFFRYFRKDLALLQKVFTGFDMIFTIGDKYSFRINIDEFDYNKNYPTFVRYLNVTAKQDEVNNSEFDIDENNKDSREIVKTDVKEEISKNTKIKMKSVTGDDATPSAEELDNVIDIIVDEKMKETEEENNTEEVYEEIDKNPEIAKLIAYSKDEEKLSKSTAKREIRINKLRDSYQDVSINNKKISNLKPSVEAAILKPAKEVKVDALDDTWDNLTYMNFEKTYNKELKDYHFGKILEHFGTNVKYPIMVTDIKVENKSTTEDKYDEYSIETEDSFGKRATLKIHLPRFINDRSIFIKGNEKKLQKQLVLFPVAKTETNCVQIVSNYNKLFIELFGSTSNVIEDRILKTLTKLQEKGSKTVKITTGNATELNKYYVLPNDYVEMSGKIYRIEADDVTYYFDQSEIRDIILKKKPNEKFDTGIPFAINNKTNMVYVYDGNIPDITFSYMLNEHLKQNKEYSEAYDGTSIAKRYSYSRVRILSARIPLIVFLAFNEGLLTVLDKSNVQYEILDKNDRDDRDLFDYIKFSDRVIKYKITNNSSILMNGLKVCNTQEYTLAEMNQSQSYIDIIGQFGSKTLADPIESFHELELDPMTLDVIHDLKLPDKFTELLLYANDMLSDNSYEDHNIIYNNRLRSNEIINGLLYKSLCESYQEYKMGIRNGRRDNKISIKPTCVIDKLLTQNTMLDASKSTALLEMEESETASKKGFGGMNLEKGYKLNKRQYDESMLNVLSISSVAGPTIGINRSLTMNAQITDAHGYIRPTGVNEMTAANTFCITEALNPFVATSDAGERIAMTYSQGKHTVRTQRSSPLLVTYGADEAMPYMISDTFAYKAPFDGKIKEITDDYIALESNDNETHYVATETISKNVNTGTFNAIKLKSDLKVGQKFKEGSIIAHDPLSFSGEVGQTDNLAYNVGCMAKVGVVAYPFGFEDSCKITKQLARNMMSQVTTKKEINLGKNANVFNLINKGDDVQQGQSLMVIQNSFDDEDLNIVLKNMITDEDGDSEVIDDLGRIPVKSKYTGRIEDIKIFRTVELSELSPTLRKLCEKYEAPTKKLRNQMKKEKNNQVYSDVVEQPDYKLEPTGQLKGIPNGEGVQIRISITYNDIMAWGDKLTFTVALKGTVGDTYDEDKVPYSSYRKDEHIDTLLNSTSVNKRMTPSVFKIGGSNKFAIELGRQVKDMLGIPYDVNFR